MNLESDEGTIKMAESAGESGRTWKRTMIICQKETRDRMNGVVVKMSAELGYKISQDAALILLLNQYEAGKLAQSPDAQ